MATMPTPLAWLIVAENGGEDSPSLHAGMAVGIVKAVTEPWGNGEAGYGFDGPRYVSTGVVVLRLTDGHAGRLAAGSMRVKRKHLPRVGWTTVPARALDVLGPDALEAVPPNLARKTTKIGGQVIGLIARASAGLEQRRFRPAA